MATAGTAAANAAGGGGWYTNSYGGPFRTSRLRAPSLLPPPRFTTLPVQQTLVIDAVRHTAPNNGENKDELVNVRRRETIFGPDVGEDDEPGWTRPDEGQKVDVDVVKGWVEKAKSEEGLHATTTLQALVNLKRPTLLLQHLEADRRGSVDSHDLAGGEITPVNDSRVSIARPTSMIQQPLHLLKFNYDATTPLVNITLSVYPQPPPPVENHPDGKSIPSIAEEEPKVIYSGTHQGGFNQVFNLPPDSAIDLSSAIAPLSNDSSLSVTDGSKDQLIGSGGQTGGETDLEHGMTNINLSGTTPDLATVPEVTSPSAGGNTNNNDRRRAPRRFGLFGRRNREADVEAGEIELENRQEEEKNDGPQEPEKGMRLLIRLEGVGAEGAALKRRNAQLTHILISGMWSADNSSTTNPVAQAKQVWVVKVVRREALIGAHTFLLKEIYGLSSANQQSESTSYPPAHGGEDPYSSTPNECIVCLTAPRDVVLLPCRHLVVCRDCAVGMVEFGAGGKVGRREDATAEGEGATGTAGAPATGTGAATGGSGTTQVAGGTTATGRERRKKKAKGWYCPVCRQPYTSLLRLALPESNKPELHDPVNLARIPSRGAQSIRSVRTVNTINPTLPAGAEKMLENLRPKGAADGDADLDGSDVEAEAEGSRPQFVVGEDEDKGGVEHDEGSRAERGSSPRSPTDKDKDGKSQGWREASAA